MFQIHNIQMPDTGGPQIPDRLILASVLNLTFPAGANNVGAAGAVTAGTGYTFSPTLTPTGGTVTAQVLTGGQVTTPLGYQAVLRPVMKVISAAVGVGGTGYVTNDVVAFGNGIFLTATASAGVVTAWAVTQAGAFANPGGLPGTGVGSVPAASQISTSGVGVGATAVLTWGIGSVVVDDSGNYSAVPTGITVTSVDGNGTGGAVAAPVVYAAGAGNPTFRQVGPFVNDGISPPPGFGVTATANVSGLTVQLQAKVTGYASVILKPILATGNVTAGTLDALIWA